MMKQRIVTALLVVALLSILWSAPARAQGGGWSEPYRLSSEDGKASEAYMVADQYGYIQSFWIETLYANQHTVIKYSRFDGTTWTKPNDIYVTERGIRNVSPFVDQQGVLHLAWAEGLVGPAYYTYAPANNALSAQDWATPIQINIPARFVFLRADSKGILHIIYIDQTDEAGVYYIRSEDRGITWTEPLWLDPDILPGHIPDSLSFELDENDGLHAAWFYGGRDPGAVSDWVRYTHSFDGGRTWSRPFTIDRHIEGSDHDLDVASPVMIVHGQAVHVIWAAGTQPYRNHRYSLDAGLTWSAPIHIFGELHGQAFDGLAVDRSGRIHFLGQIRYPMAIYHAYWDQNRWSQALPVYLIAAEGSTGGFGDRVHAHFTIPVIRAGNQLVLTFTDPPSDPNRRLFVMYRTLDDIPALDSRPTPTPTVTPVQTPTPMSTPPTTMSSWTLTPPSFESAVQPVGNVPAPDFAIRVALVPTLLILVAMTMIQLYKRKQ